MKPPGGPLPAVDFAVAPFLVIWETTQACALACRHCRASARPERDPLELSMEEGFDVIDQVADMGTPLLVLTGLTMSPAVTAAFPSLLDLFGGFQSARTLHFGAFAALILFVFVHVGMVIASGFWKHMRAMTLGG